MPNLIKTDEYFDLSEIYQSVDLCFAPLLRKGNDYHMIHTYVKCRDYFTDLVDALHNEEDYEEIYGITAQGHSNPWENDKTYIALEGDPAKMKYHLPLLRAFEKKCGLRQSTMVSFKGSKDILLTGSLKWSSAGAYISLYTHLIRCMYSASDEDFTTLDELLSFMADAGRGNDSNYQCTISKNIDIELLVTNISKFASLLLAHPNDGTEDDGVNIIHNYGGIVSLAKVVGDDLDDCKWEDANGEVHLDEEYLGPMSMFEQILPLYKELS